MSTLEGLYQSLPLWFDRLTTTGKNPLVLSLSKDQNWPDLKYSHGLYMEELREGDQGGIRPTALKPGTQRVRNWSRVFPAY